MSTQSGRRYPRRSAMTDALNLMGFDTNEDGSSGSEIEDEIQDNDLRDNDSSSSSDEDAGGSTGEWRTVQSGTDSVRRGPEFTGTTGLHPRLEIPNELEDDMFFLNHFFTDDLMQDICDYTNNRLWQELVDNPESQKLQNSRQVTVNEIRKFIGLQFLMALNKKPTLASYWSGDLVFRQEIFSSPESLSRDRFQLILNYIRFADPENLENDYLAKVRPFLEKVNNICQNTYLPNRQISIDETLMLFKGRLRIRQYIPSKRRRYGIKSYVLAESESGYVWKMMLHGLSTENRAVGLSHRGAETLSVTERIVIQLSHDLFNQGYHVYLDNFYTSCRLARYLFRNGTFMTGTVKANRGVPSDLKHLNLPVKSQAYSRNGEVLCVKLVDQKSSGKKTVYLMDTFAAAEDVEVSRIVKGGHHETVKKSRSVLNYNAHMGGVDRLDAALHHYDINRKNYTWFVKYCLHLIQIMHYNSWILYRKNDGKMNYLDYCMKSVNRLVLQTGIGRNPVGRPRLVPRSTNNRCLEERNPQHKLERIPAREGEPRPHKRCRVCYQAGKRKETVFRCADCPGQPGLCAAPCFSKYHE